MSKTLARILRLTLLFFHSVYGCIQNPYVTYRTLSLNPKDSMQAVWIAGIIAAYFAFASLLRTGVRSPFLLTLHFNSLMLAAIAGFLGVVLLLGIAAKLYKIPGSVKTLASLWAFTLLPTVLWFFFTSIMYIFLPPPRTLSFPGKLYSIVFITLSVTLLSWKLILYYLTLRFGLRMGLKQILFVSTVIIPCIGVYSVLMYKAGIFRVPFI